MYKLLIYILLLLILFIFLDSKIFDYFDTGVPRVIYSFWTGSNKITPIRLKIIKKMKQIMGIKHVLVTPDNLDEYILPQHPLHPGYKYLSRVHKSDYLRCYFMHHYGGGYSDLKFPTASWLPSFNKIDSNSSIWCIGVPLEGKYVIPDNISEQEKNVVNEIYHQNKLVSISYFICRPNTPFTQKWYNDLLKLMDQKLYQLKKHPAVFTRESFDRPPSKWYRDETEPKLKSKPCPTQPTQYPISWNEILGRINWLAQARYINHIKKGLPPPSSEKYDNFEDD